MNGRQSLAISCMYMFSSKGNSILAVASHDILSSVICPWHRSFLQASCERDVLHGTLLAIPDGMNNPGFKEKENMVLVMSLSNKQKTKSQPTAD